MLLVQESGSGPLPSLLFFAVLVLGFFLLVLRPQRVRARQMAEVHASLRPGARVMTTAQLIATVVAVDDEDGTVVLEIAPGVHATFARGAVVRDLDADEARARRRSSSDPETGPDGGGG